LIQEHSCFRDQKRFVALARKIKRIYRDGATKYWGIGRIMVKSHTKVGVDFIHGQFLLYNRMSYSDWKGKSAPKERLRLRGETKVVNPYL
jgi:hypothetical protein